MALLAGGLLAALAPAVLAAPVGRLVSLRPLDASGAAHGAGEDGAATAFELRTDAGVLLRVSLLRADLIHVQAGAKGQLTPAGDKAAPIVLPRRWAAVEHRVVEQVDRVEIQTAALTLRIHRKPLRLELLRAGEAEPLWRELQPLDLAEKRAVQTLSSTTAERFYGGGQQNGRFEFKGHQLDISYSGGWEDGDRPSPAPFLMSSRGWGVLRNTWSDGSYDLRLDEQASLEHAEGRFDAYYFVGSGLHDVLAAYTELTGRAKLLPRWALEYGDADCYNDGDNAKKPGTVPKGWSDGPTGKTPDVVDSVAKQYREHDMPGGWVLPNDGYGCGYTDLPKVVQGLAQYGFKTGLWTENGVDKIKWEVGTAGTRAQKLDVAWTGKGYQFSLDANKAAYDGILDNSDARPFLWTVMGWAGTQRYAVTWTGDQSASWDYIRWHIPTLIGSGLSGQAYASGDVDAIFGGSPETFTRDLQWKSFTPVLMGMSGWAEAERKHPWWFGEPYRSINRKYLKLKLRLTPLMYTLAREAEQTGAPLVRGLMWDHASDPQAGSEAFKHQFLLGPDVLVAPVFRSQAASQGWRKGIHLPQGRWLDYWDGRQLSAGPAGCDLDLAVTLDKLPVFVRAGAILPMYPEVLFDGQKPKDRLTLDLYPDASRPSEFNLYEDDGLTRRYQGGAFSTQRLAMRLDGDALQVTLEPVKGSYDGQEAARAYSLRVASRQAPSSVELDGKTLPQVADLDAVEEGWRFDAADRRGSIHVKTGRRDIRAPLAFLLRGVQAAPAADDDFPAAPATGRAVPADSLSVVNRPAEEPGHPLENAFDDKPQTWFRTTRNQALRSGPHEWVLGLGERRLIDGIELAPRNDKNWKYGQVRDYEVYLADNNGDWGEPVARGRLQLQQGPQQIAFRATAGRLLRFRVLSVQNPEGDAASGADPMVTAAADAPAKAFNAFVPADVGPITLSSFKVLEARASEGRPLQRALSDLALPAGTARDKPASGASAMRMNGLLFRKGLGMKPGQQLQLQLAGHWQTFRADLGVDDSCRNGNEAGGLHFQVWGDGRLLYDSGVVQAPAVVKPELDVRGLRQLSLRTLGARGRQPQGVCGNWANALLLGQEGDEVQIAPAPQKSKRAAQPR
ncbi:TIM-barrel domain-containing protein [Roseateles saccharophilus]|uniref:TIM-barrel domain-containing protein n=1 Tax=Roseateles saccharophilus TaxID=304 RepID=UPI002407A190|nr:TIM-barrel domain-containing protein [Roseateles saccharophilus]